MTNVFKSSSSSINTIKEETAPAPTGTDFQEDPFKNYRYEDPFLIEDPFNDENANPTKSKEKGLCVFILLKFLNNFFIFFSDKFADFFEKDSFEQATNLFEKHDFGDTFDDSLNNNNGQNEKHDPFGLSVNDLNNFKNTTATSNAFGFDADFSKFDSFNNNNNAASKANNNNNFNFNESDVWSETKSSRSKVKKYNDVETKTSKISKFTTDYSDNYEKDLEQVLKRSMMDQ